jgi:hypothetical protein
MSALVPTILRFRGSSSVRRCPGIRSAGSGFTLSLDTRLDTIEPRMQEDMPCGAGLSSRLQIHPRRRDRLRPLCPRRREHIWLTLQRRFLFPLM